MLTDLVDNYDIDNDELIELPQLKDLHYELINENIKDQIEDPTESHVNFIDQYFLSVESELNENEENIELVQNLKADIVKFCTEVILLIDEKYDLNIDREAIEDLNIEKLKSLTYSLYEFFVIKYLKNLKKFYIKYIMTHLDELSDLFSDNPEPNDVVFYSFKEKLKDPRAVIILVNLDKVIEYINTLDINGMDLIGYYNPERYDVYIISEAMQDLILSETFVPSFIEPMNDKYDESVFIKVKLSVESSLLKKFKKVDEKNEEY